jgi:hypothetical protein
MSLEFQVLIPPVLGELCWLFLGQGFHLHPLMFCEWATKVCRSVPSACQHTSHLAIPYTSIPVFGT